MMIKTKKGLFLSEQGALNLTNFWIFIFALIDLGFTVGGFFIIRQILLTGETIGRFGDTNYLPLLIYNGLMAIVAILFFGTGVLVMTLLLFKKRGYYFTDEALIDNTTLRKATYKWSDFDNIELEKKGIRLILRKNVKKYLSNIEIHPDKKEFESVVAFLKDKIIKEQQ